MTFAQGWQCDPTASTSNAITVVTTSLSIPDTSWISSSKTRALEINSTDGGEKAAHTHWYLLIKMKIQGTTKNGGKHNAGCETLYVNLNCSWWLRCSSSWLRSEFSVMKAASASWLKQGLVATTRAEARLWPAQTCHFSSVWAPCPSHRSQPSPGTSCVTDLFSSTALIPGSAPTTVNKKKVKKKKKKLLAILWSLFWILSMGLRKKVWGEKIIMPFFRCIIIFWCPF